MKFNCRNHDCVLTIFLGITLSSFLIMNIKIASLNLNGARDAKKRAVLYDMIKLKGIDVILTQETHSNLANEIDWCKEWEGTVVLSHNSSTSAGVAILFARSFTPASYTVEEEVEGRLLKVKAIFENTTFMFVNTYTPVVAAERLLFLGELSDTLATCNTEDYLFLGGDFNSTVSDLDRNHAEPHMASRRSLMRLVETHELCDVWRNLNGANRQYTWAHARDNTLSLARLDRLYCFKHHSCVQNVFYKSCGVF